MSGLELCPKCKKGHLYPVVTASANAEPKGQFKETGGIRDYECDICGPKQKGAKQKAHRGVKNQVSATVQKTEKPKPKPNQEFNQTRRNGVITSVT